MKNDSQIQIPYRTIALMSVFGIATAVLFSVFKWPCDINIRMLIAGGGVSVFVAAILHLIWSKTTKKIIDRMEDKMKMAEKVALDVLGVRTNIRYEQVINIKFENPDNDNNITATVEHTFYYQAENNAGQQTSVELFSDFRGKILSSEQFEDQKVIPNFYYERIEENYDIIAKWENLNDRKCLCEVKFGKLYFYKNITMPPKNDHKRFLFVSKRKYSLDDRLVWAFQEMAYSPVTIKLKSDSNNMNFYFRINHQNVEKIIRQHNSRCNNANGNNSIIDNQTGKIKGTELTLKIYESILPYQGFEISWDLPKE